MKIFIVFIFIVPFILIAQKHESKVVYFKYGTNQNTNAFGLLEFRILEHQGEIEMKFDSETTYIHFLRTDNNSSFVKTNTSLKQSYSLGHGTYVITIAKSGYDTIVIHNYQVIPDQFSYSKVFQEKGNGRVDFTAEGGQLEYSISDMDTTFYEDGKISTVSKNIGNTYKEEYNFYPDGALKNHTHTLENGMQSVSAYYPSGNIRYLSFVNQGFTLGYFKKYYPNGRIESHSIYQPTEKGMSPSVLWMAKDSLGNYKIKNGNTIKSWRKQNDFSTHVNRYRNGVKNGIWYDYNLDWKKVKKSDLKKTSQGMHILIYKNGVLRKKKEFASGVLTLYEIYDENGVLIKKNGIYVR